MTIVQAPALGSGGEEQARAGGARRQAKRAPARRPRLQLSWLTSLRQAWRKQVVFRRRLTPRKLLNLALCVLGFALKRQLSGAVPPHVKVDIIPACQLRCSVCIHSAITQAERRQLPRMMSVELFRKLVDDVAGRTIAMSLYNLGEPLLHPRLSELVGYAESQGINTYITTNFSLPLDDRRMEEMVRSGLTMLIVAVDGVSKDTYGPRRVGGDWNLVLANLRKLVEAKRRLGASYPHLLLQYLVFEHNAHEVGEVETFSSEVGIDQTIFIDGIVGSWTEREVVRPEWKPKAARPLPRCAWPYFSTLVNADGTVVGCCNHRGAENYIQRQLRRSMGDIRQAPLQQIYRGEAYKAARAIVSDPRQAGAQEAHFCAGCRVVSD